MLKIIKNSICYPKSKVIIIPANTRGIMTKGRPSEIIKDGLSGIIKEAKGIISNNKIEVGSCFITGPGRLKRRGLEYIYHAVIKRLQDDIPTLYNVEQALNFTLNTAVNNGMESITVCGLGIEPGGLDKKSVARITVASCKKFENRIDIKIIDNDEEFINEINFFVKE